MIVIWKNRFKIIEIPSINKMTIVIAIARMHNFLNIINFSMTSTPMTNQFIAIQKKFSFIKWTNSAYPWKQIRTMTRAYMPHSHAPPAIKFNVTTHNISIRTKNFPYKSSKRAIIYSISSMSKKNKSYMTDKTNSGLVIYLHYRTQISLLQVDKHYHQFQHYHSQNPARN